MVTVTVRCKYCNKIIRGVNQRQVDAQMIIHKVMKHSDKLTITENEKEKKM